MHPQPASANRNPGPAARAAAFRSSFARRQAAAVTEAVGGFVVADPALPRSNEHNQLVLDGTAAPEAVLAALEGPLGHRQVSVLTGELGDLCTPLLTAAGYTRDDELVLAHTGPLPPLGERTPDGAAAGGVRSVEPEELRAAVEREQRRWNPDGDAELLRQLAGRGGTRRRGAPEVLFLTSRAADGEPAAWADLYLDPAAGIAQIEGVVTAERYSRRGHADAVLADGLRRAAAAGCGLFFLVADADDWPRHWYARRGFTEVGRSHRFYRPR